jgi:putative addiction module component (TIGR02574 family)
VVDRADAVTYREYGMSDQVQKLLEQVKQLPADDQQEFAEGLMEEMETQRLAEGLWADPDWRAEMDRRLQSVEDGTGDLVPWEQARDEIRAELDRRRAARAAGQEP